MAFNDFASATKICSNDSTKTCTQNVDCGTGNTCGTTGNLDAARVLYMVGKGKCSATTATVCTKQAHCPSGETCVLDVAGDHATPASLIRTIDDIRAATWTPFAEAYYNAIGYFGVLSTDTTGKTSRTDIRINATDFPNAYNPSEYVCQANNILLITDGASTADQNSSKNTLVNTYKALSGNVTGTCSKYAGSQDLDDLAWIARQRNINTLTAVNGGTGLLRTEIPSQYQDALRTAFAAVAGGTASGTAASILSNSEGSGANILQAVFYPIREFETRSGETKASSASWIGEMQNLWYYVDPYISSSTVREDTDINNTLNIINDYVVEFQFKGGDTLAVLKKDTNGDGSGETLVTSTMDDRVTSQGYCTNATTPSISTYAKCTSDAACISGETCVVQGVVGADYIRSLWRAGKLLWQRDLTSSPRKLYTNLYGVSAPGCAGTFSLVDPLLPLSGLYNLAAIDWGTIGANDKCILKAFLQASSDAEAQNIINYVHGYDSPTVGTIDGVTPRKRTVMIGGVDKVWKLGDIISSTPRIQSFNKLNNYHQDPPLGYAFFSYDTAATGVCR